jgi:hypothetical protein
MFLTLFYCNEIFGCYTSSSACTMDGNEASKIENGEDVARCRQQVAAPAGVPRRRKRWIRRPHHRDACRGRTCSRTNTVLPKLVTAMCCQNFTKILYVSPEILYQMCWSYGGIRCVNKLSFSFCNDFSFSTLQLHVCYFCDIYVQIKTCFAQPVEMKFDKI